MDDKYIIGVDAGGDKVAYGLFDGAGAIVGCETHPTDAGADGPVFCDTMAANIRALLFNHKLSFDALHGIGVGMPSYILHDEGRILMTSSIPAIRDFPMLDYLQERLPVRIALDNDANAAAIAEHRRGAGRGSRHMVYVVVGTGLGGGIIIDGRLFHGSYGWAGEIGHMLATPGDGIMCGCENRGCFMSYTTGKSLRERVGLKLSAGTAGAGAVNTVMADTHAGAASLLSADTADGYSLLDAYNKGDALAAEIYEETARYLAVCLYNVYEVLNIDTYVFGGGLINLGAPLFDRVRELFGGYDHIRAPVYFKMAELKKDAGIIGAAELVSGTVGDGPNLSHR